jgi:hypothetical protein
MIGPASLADRDGFRAANALRSRASIATTATSSEFERLVGEYSRACIVGPNLSLTSPPSSSNFSPIHSES